MPVNHASSVATNTADGGYEFAWRGMTLQTRAATPDLLSEAASVMAALMMATGIQSQEALAEAGFCKRLGFAHAIMQRIPALMWSFLSPEMRFRAGVRDRFLKSVCKEAVSGFLSWIEGQMTLVLKVVGRLDTGSPRASLDTVYAALCKAYGWSDAEVRELSTLQIHAYLKELCFLQKQEAANQLSMLALAASAGAGSKKSFDQIKKVTRDVEIETRQRQHREGLKADGKVPGAVIPLFEVGHE